MLTRNHHDDFRLMTHAQIIRWRTDITKMLSQSSLSIRFVAWLQHHHFDNGQKEMSRLDNNTYESCDKWCNYNIPQMSIQQRKQKCLNVMPIQDVTHVVHLTWCMQRAMQMRKLRYQQDRWPDVMTNRIPPARSCVGHGQRGTALAILGCSTTIWMARIWEPFKRVLTPIWGHGHPKS